MEKNDYSLYQELNKCFMITHEQEKCCNQMMYFKKHGNDEQIENAEIKLSVHEGVRQEYFENLNAKIEAIDSLMSRMCKIDEMRESIARQINQIYNQNGTFDDYFDGFKIKFEPYKKEYQKINEELWNYDASEELLQLHYEYLNYLYMHVDEMIMSSCGKISNVLYNFFDDSGEKVEAYNMSRDPEVLVINEDQIRQLIDYMRLEYGKYKKEYNKIYKNFNSASEEEKTSLSMQAKKVEEKINYISYLDFVVQVLQNRVNVHHKNQVSLKYKIKSDILDFQNKIFYPIKKRPNNWTFITKEEIDYIEYLEKNIDKESIVLDKLFDSFKKQEQEAIVFPEFGF